MNLNELSPQEILEVAYGIQEDMEKQASEHLDLNEFTPDELLGLAYEIHEDFEKQASEELDLNQLSPEEILEVAYGIHEDFEKQASEGFDLNQLSPEELIDFAVELEQEMTKEAGAGADKAKALKEYLIRTAKGERALKGFRHARSNYKAMQKDGVSEAKKNILKNQRSAAAKQAALGAVETGAMYGAPTAGALSIYKNRK